MIFTFFLQLLDHVKAIHAKEEDVRILETVMFADVLMELLEANVKVSVKFYQSILFCEIFKTEAMSPD